jgi:hypothetical protein
MFFKDDFNKIILFSFCKQKVLLTMMNDDGKKMGRCRLGGKDWMKDKTMMESQQTQSPTESAHE